MKRSSYRGEHKGSTLKARSKIAASRMFRAALAFVLAVGLAPTLSFAGQEAGGASDVDVQPTPVVEQQAPAEDATPSSTTTAETPSGPTTPEPVTTEESEPLLGASSNDVPMSVASVAASDITITPSAAEGVGSYTADGKFYANGEVKVQVSIVSGLEENDRVSVKVGSGDAKETTITSGTTSFSESVVVSGDTAGNYDVVVTVTPSSGTPPVTKTQTVVIDTTQLQAPDVSVTPAASDTSASGTIYFDLASASLEVKATTKANAQLDTTKSKLVANGKEITAWSKKDSNVYEATASITAADLVNSSATKNATVAVTLVDKFGVSKTYDLVYESNTFKFVEHSDSTTPVNLTSESGLLPEQIITLSGDGDATAACFKDKVTVTVGLSNDVLKSSSLKDTVPTITPNDATFGALTDDKYTATVTKTSDETKTYTVTAPVTTAHKATKTYTKEFKIDGRAPTLTVKWNDADITSKKQETGEGGVWVYGAARVATVTISDDTGLNNSDIAALKTAWENAGGTVSSETSSTTQYAATVTFDKSQSSAYTFTVPTVRDTAGNPMTCTDANFKKGAYSDTFKIMKDPVLTITPITTTTDKVGSTDLYKDKREFKLSMKTLAEWTAPTVSITKDGALNTSVAAEWKPQADGITYEATVAVDQTATYNDLNIDWDTNTFVVVGSTEAAATSYTLRDTFIVDATAPVLKVDWGTDPTPVKVGDATYYESARTATITVTDETMLNSTSIAAINAELNHLGASGVKETSNTGKEYVLVATFDKNYYKDSSVCSLVVPNVHDKAGHDLAVADDDTATKAHFDAGKHKYTEPDFKMLVHPSLRVASVEKLDGSPIERDATSYYKQSLKVTWALEAVSFTQARKLAINPRKPAKENDGWKQAGDLAFTADVVFADTDGVLTSGITVSGKEESPVQKFYAPASKSQDKVSENLVDEYVFVPNDFAVDDTAPTLKVAWEKASTTPATTETVDDANNIRYYGNGIADAVAVTATFTVTETNPLGAGNIVVSYGDGESVDLANETPKSGVYTLTHTYKNDGKYAVAVSGDGDEGAARDLVRHVLAAADGSTTVAGGKYGTTVIIDRKAPEVAVAYFTDYGNASAKKQLAANADGAFYANKKITAEIVVTEQHFDAAATGMIDADGGTIVKQAGAQEWKDNGDGTYTALVEFDANALSSVAFAPKLNIVDKAGNPTEPATIESSVVVDKVTPKLKVSYSTKPVDSEKDATSDEIRYYDNQVVATIVVDDEYVSTDDLSVTAEGATATMGSWDPADPTKPTITVTFPATADSEASYDLKVSGKDKAGNELESGASGTYVDPGTHEYQSSIIVDQKKPVLTVTWNNTAVQNGKYYQDERTPTITVEETYFKPENITIGGEATKAEDWDTPKGSVVHTYKNAQTYKNGTHQLKISGKDYAANVLEGGDNAVPPAEVDASGAYDSREFVVDTDDPVVTVSMSQERSNQYAGTKTDYYRTGNQLVVTVKVDDATFNPSVDAEKVDGHNRTWIDVTGTTDAYEVASWADGVYTLTFKPNDASGAPARNTLKITAYDLGGRSTVFTYGDAATDKASASDIKGVSLSGSNGFALDIHAPELAPGNGVDIPSRMFSNNYSDTLVFYKDPTTLRIVVTDVLGIDTIVGDGSSYNFSNVSGVSGDSDWAVEVTLRDGAEFTNEFLLTATDVAANKRMWKINPKTLDVDDISTPDSNTALYDAQKDLFPIKLILDTTAPVVDLSPKSLVNGFYNSTQTVTTTVTELNFAYLKQYDGSQVVTTMTKQEGNAGRATSVSAYPVSVFNQSGGSASVYATSVDLSEDGHYTFAAHVKDPAGNEGSDTLGEITIDKTAPVIQDIVFDNNDARNGKYYKAGRTATITVIEHNWDPSLFTITTNGSISGWSDSGDTHTCTVSFTTDGTYNLSVSGRDKAGNEAAAKQVDEFVVDLTAPTIDFSNVAAQTAYNGEVAPVINYHDEANFDTNGMTWTLTGNKHGGQAFAASQGSSGNDGTVSFSDFPREVEVDDIYTLQAHLTDMAGNEADNSITFSVNRFGSNFIVLDENMFTEHKGYLAEPIEIRVQEINVSGAQSEQHGVSVTHGLTTENLDRKAAGTASSDGFYIDAGTDSAGWSTYTYHIGTGNFSDDGNYHVVVSSTDTATNLNNSASYYNPAEHKVADAEVSFILDTADPIIDGISVHDGELVDANAKTLSFTVTDNIGFDTVKVVVDGEEQAVEPEMGGLCNVDLPAKAFTARDLEIVATDLAGRTAQAAVNGFHYTDNFFELNLPLVVGGVIVIAAAAVGGVMFVRRRNGQEG